MSPIFVLNEEGSAAENQFFAAVICVHKKQLYASVKELRKVGGWARGVCYLREMRKVGGWGREYSQWGWSFHGLGEGLALQGLHTRKESLQGQRLPAPCPAKRRLAAAACLCSP